MPEGKKAVWKNGKIEFIDAEPHWKSIKTFNDAFWYCDNDENLTEYITNYSPASADTYGEKVAELRLVIAALTDNEKLSLASGTVYYPVLQFYKADCPGLVTSSKNIIGTIITEGERYVVAAITAHTTCLQGLGDFPPDCHFSSVSTGINIGLPSKEIADHLTKYFGKLLFEVMYGMCNCEWEWVE